MAESLLLIPDISGFSDFVNQTEITHSQHIISELLEIIIRSQNLEMEVAEVEGDAVLFFKEEKIPDLDQVINQAEIMFLQFHRHLKDYEHHRICNCGACSTAVNLSLKMVVHKSEIGFTTVNNKKKPFGPGVVLVHRLLKNNIQGSEYILFSESWQNEIREYSGISDAAPEFISGKDHYPDTGEINYVYIGLSPLLSRVDDITPINLNTFSDNPLVYEGIIRKPVDLVYEVISNLDFRHKWNKGVKDIIYEKNKVNRIGTKHICVFSGNQVEFKTINGKAEPKQMVYGEQLEKAPFNKKVDFYYILDHKNGNTKVRIEIHFHPVPVIGFLVMPLMKMRFKATVKDNFKALKTYCENNLPDSNE